MNQDYYYKITARDSSGVLFSSYPQKIFFPTWVKRIRQSYLGAPAEIPGIIEAENFDKGGEGLAYHDADDINLAGAYRPDEEVDIYDRNGTGYHIGNAIEGEWYEYLIHTRQDRFNGAFTIQLSDPQKVKLLNL